ncbi:three-helix bundle dimerization domain-containing protein [Rhodococcus jostii]|uniref:three-helix bundle dimerization domain-containing protein n=1 Tax=Rhodococcus jostii TaxID=132919 RepID=UPI000934A725
MVPTASITRHRHLRRHAAPGRTTGFAPKDSRINQAIDTAHRRFDGRPVRDFVPLLVERAAIRSLTVDT